MTTAGTPAIELRGVTRAYVSDDDAPATTALDGVDLAIGRGELVAVCGPSGSGKSTFLHLAGALDTPTSGEVIVDGADVGDLTAAARADLRNRSIGFVFQAFNLMQGLTAAENIGLPAVLARRKPADIDASVADLLDLVGLAARADRRPSQLSGGEQQRVALARALVLDPPIVLADEPTGNLDTNAGRAVLDLLLASHSAGRTVVIVTHDQRIAAQAERVIYLRDGKVAQEAHARPAPANLTGLLDTTVGS
ncbi:MAG TPA: ABC transporter ATP-binding protein [Acidimicrobiales bacterium]|nr:ABC transporter ATP-binding protein [Acidimicrobiales bacterium]